MGRRDAKLVKKLDSMHVIVPLLYPGRCDNEAYISERIDLTKINDYIKSKNEELASQASEGEDVFKYTIFHFVVAAIKKFSDSGAKAHSQVCNAV